MIDMASFRSRTLPPLLVGQVVKPIAVLGIALRARVFVPGFAAKRRRLFGKKMGHKTFQLGIAKLVPVQSDKILGVGDFNAGLRHRRFVFAH